MKVVQFSRFGEPEVLETIERETPTPGPRQILIKVAAAGINFADTQMRQNRYPVTPQLPCVLGIEVSGTIALLGGDVKGFDEGDRVAAALYLAGGEGGYSEYVVVEVGAVLHLPDAVTFANATALLMQGLTALFLVRETAVAGKSLLVTAAAGGVGSILVQLARLAGARLVVGAASASKLQQVRTLGVDAAIDYTRDDWVERAIQESESGFDLVYDSVGGTITNASLGALGLRGELIVYGALNLQAFAFGGNELAALMFGNKAVRGFALHPLITPESARAGLTELFDMVADGRLKLLPGASYPFGSAAEAHRALEQRQSSGKLVLVP